MTATENGDWDENRKLVLQTLASVPQQINDVAERADRLSSSRHKIVLDRLTQLEKRMSKKDDSNEEKFVSRKEFNPISRLVYGLVGIVLTGVAVAILGIVISRGVI